MTKTSAGSLKQRHHRGRLATTIVVAALAFSPAAAYASGSAQGTYGGKGGDVIGTIQGGSNDGTPSGQSPAGPSADPQTAQLSGLPFTGMDVGLALGGGLVLLASGVGLGRLVARRDGALRP
jgi:hypothetical protein